MRRHGWQRPLHPLQIVGIAVFSFLVVAFYTFFGLFLGSKIAEITVTTLFTFVAVSVILLFVRCTAIDPTDKTRCRKKRKLKSKRFSKQKYGYILGQIVMGYFKRMERKILRTFIRRRYLDPWKFGIQAEPSLPYPLLMKDDESVTPELKEDDMSYCSLCDFEVKKHSKHCRTCNRCVEGFDHHCRWLNNCVGKKNYTTFILLMVFVLLMLVIEGGTAIAIFVRCFADKGGIERELKKKLYVDFPRGALATISVMLVLMTVYSSAAMGQLFFFHVVLIRKGMRTYDYIMAMKEENQSMEVDPFDDSDFSSDYSTDSELAEKPQFMSQFICGGQAGVNQNPRRLSIRIEGEPQSSGGKKEGFRASINPWKLIKMSREKALLAAEKARDRLKKQNTVIEDDPVKHIQIETKCGPFESQDKIVDEITPVISKAGFAVSPRRFSSPRRRFSGSAALLSGTLAASQPKYRSDFDMKLVEVSTEFETYISRQALCSLVKKDEREAPPR